MNPLVNLIAGPLIEGVGKIIDRVIPDKAAAEKAKQEMAVMLASQEFQLSLEQIKVNLEEAKSTNWVVAGWRPACGWVGAFALAYAAIFEPILRFLAMTIWEYGGPFPELDTTITMQVLFGILGLGAYRAVEKVKGVAR
jgi:hypothetical protein